MIFQINQMITICNILVQRKFLNLKFFLWINASRFLEFLNYVLFCSFALHHIMQENVLKITLNFWQSDMSIFGHVSHEGSNVAMSITKSGFFKISLVYDVHEECCKCNTACGELWHNKKNISNSVLGLAKTLPLQQTKRRKAFMMSDQ